MLHKVGWSLVGVTESCVPTVNCPDTDYNTCKAAVSVTNGTVDLVRLPIFHYQRSSVRII
jgi:hypothetical protein